MGIETILLVIAALIPAVVLCVYIYKKDKADKEPIGTLLLLLLCGVLICFPVLIVGGILGPICQGLFPTLSFAPTGEIYGDEASYVAYQFVHATIEVALVEEGFKWLVLMLFAKKCKHFNSLFDGIIYAVFVSLGFAAFENILYVLQNGWTVAIVRAVLSVPGHMFFAVLMGIFFSDYFIIGLARKTEEDYKRRGLLVTGQPAFSETKSLVLSLLVPTLAHGLFDFFLFVGTAECLVGYFALVVGLYIFCFKRIRSTSRQDTHAMLCVLKLMDAKYPGLSKMVANEQNTDGDPNGTTPSFPLYPTGVQTGTAPAQSPNVRFAGFYTNAPGTVHIVAGVKQPVSAGSTLLVIQTGDGQTFPIITNIPCQVDKYNVFEGEFVQPGRLLGVMKYTG